MDPPKRTGIIYVVTRKRDNKKYVGQTVRGLNVRKNEHIAASKKPVEDRHCRLLASAIYKDGEDAFEWNEEWTGPEDELSEQEIKLIAELGTLTPGGFNLTTGGGANRTVSDETRQKSSDAHMGKALTYKKERKRPEDKDLPLYLTYSKKGNNEGYTVTNHPNYPLVTKAFMSMQDTMGEKMDMALAFLETLNNGTHVPESKPLPMGIQEVDGGYRVVVKGYKSQRYCTSFYSKEERLEMALTYLNWIRADQEAKKPKKDNAPITLYQRKKNARAAQQNNEKIVVQRPDGDGEIPKETS
jgi:hypothetical protein